MIRVLEGLLGDWVVVVHQFPMAILRTVFAVASGENLYHREPLEVVCKEGLYLAR